MQLITPKNSEKITLAPEANNSGSDNARELTGRKNAANNCDSRNGLRGAARRQQRGEFLLQGGINRRSQHRVMNERKG